MAFLHEEEDKNHNRTDEKKEQRHLVSRLVNVIRQGGREGGRLKTSIFFKSFYNCCTILCTMSGFSNVKAVY